MKRRVFLFLVLLSLPLIALEKTQKRCPICGMFVKDNAPTSFSSVKDTEPVHFCSFSCALAFHRKHPEASLTAYDYLSGKAIPAETAFFLIKSDKFAEEFKFAMAPVAVAFQTSEAAKKVTDRVNEGQIVKGFSSLKSSLTP